MNDILIVINLCFCYYCHVMLWSLPIAEHVYTITEYNVE